MKLFIVKLYVCVGEGIHLVISWGGLCFGTHTRLYEETHLEPLSQEIGIPVG